MKYKVVVEQYDSTEFVWSIYGGEVLQDGDIEPDLMADLVSTGVLEPEFKAKPVVEAKPVKE